MEREWSVDEIIESLRTWEDRMYSESETKWLMNKAADLIEITKRGDAMQISRTNYSTLYEPRQ